MGATAAAVGAWNGTTALIVVAGLCSFLIGLEVLEPLAQEIDRCTVLDLAPVSKGEILSRHLIVPSLVAAALSTAAAVCVVPFILAGQSRSVVVAGSGCRRSLRGTGRSSGQRPPGRLGTWRAGHRPAHASARSRRHAASVPVGTPPSPITNGSTH
jgi:hypothetical protein